MNEDRDTRDRDGGQEQRTEAGLADAWDIWARAAEQALQDMARAQRYAAAREKSTARTVIP